VLLGGRHLQPLAFHGGPAILYRINDSLEWNMRQWTLIGLVILGGACGDDNIITGNNDSNNTTTNNATNNLTNNSNNIIGVACETNEECSAPANSCQGDVAVQFTGDGICGSETGVCNFFFVTQRVDCTTTVQSCEAGECVDNVCTTKICDTPADRCEGTTAVFSSRVSSCDLVTGQCLNNEARVDCAVQGAECIGGTCVGACVGLTCDAPTAGTCAGLMATSYSNPGACNPVDGTCTYEPTTTDCGLTDKICRAGLCVDFCAPNPCVTAPAGTCAGAVASIYTTPGVCDEVADSCTYPPTTTDCALTDKLCNNGVCVTDLCANVACLQPANVCTNNMAKVYSGAGACMPANGMCNFSGVEVVTDCGANTCINAACVNVSANAGDLTITEIMTNPEAVADTAGEWFEIINNTARSINVDGLVLESMGDTAYTFAIGAPKLIAPGARYVFGINNDNLTNGGVTVNQKYVGIVLDAADSITLKSGATVIDTVTWDGTFPMTPGKSMTFGNQYNPAVDDNALAASWCDGITALGTDFGTPGAANDTCP
jgi:hypothetical protein